MPAPTLARRVEILEEKVDALATLPNRVTQVEARLTALTDEFVSFRSEVRERFDNVDNRFESVNKRFDNVDGKFGSVDKQFQAVREEIREVGRHMRVLHEDVISRIALLQEGVDHANGGTARTKKPPRRKR